MTVRSIVLYVENRAVLRRKSAPVRTMNRRVQHLIRDLKDTLMHHPEGIGLAAPQINVHLRVVVVRLGSRREGGGEPDPPLALMNPVIVEAGIARRDFDGCLSFPGLFADTVRPHYLKVVGLDEGGKPLTRTFEEFDAVLAHHEIDHLDGVLFIDRVEHEEDFYTVQFDAHGRGVRAPVPPLFVQNLIERHRYLHDHEQITGS